jgi:hypothetical protein
MCGPNEDDVLELPESVNLKEGSIASRIFDVMKDQQYRTLKEIKSEAGIDAPLQNIAARLRDFRKQNYGGFRVEKYAIGKLSPTKGYYVNSSVFEYALR